MALARGPSKLTAVLAFILVASVLPLGFGGRGFGRGFGRSSGWGRRGGSHGGLFPVPHRSSGGGSKSESGGSYKHYEPGSKGFEYIPKGEKTHDHSKDSGQSNGYGGHGNGYGGYSNGYGGHGNGYGGYSNGYGGNGNGYGPGHNGYGPGYGGPQSYFHSFSFFPSPFSWFGYPSLFSPFGLPFFGGGSNPQNSLSAPQASPNANNQLLPTVAPAACLADAVKICCWSLGKKPTEFMHEGKLTSCAPYSHCCSI